ncbi:OmpH family outer membrane protein [Flavobacterium rhizosphaerae]|uniref:OmpH family outer membrane protein n=1 Tax=Flavobacterium rhizosphaerae TaxID=3163298 RepID=A0ABW8Z2F2_9FLAO
MKKHFLTALLMFAFITAGAQSARGVKIAYIDMEYILNKAPDYAEAKNQLEQKAEKWKQEIQVKRNEINRLKEALQAERALLTKELIEEREEEIRYQEKDLLDYQEKRFGPMGDLISQKAVLVKPVQDQVFSIIQDLVESRKYDFVFDKSSDLSMVFAAKRYDISDLVVKRISRSAKREKLSAKEIKNLEEEERKEELASDPEYAEKQKAIEEREAERQTKIDERKAAQDAKRAEYEARREEMKRKREEQRQAAIKAREEKQNARNNNNNNTPASNTPNTKDDPTSGDD